MVMTTHCFLCVFLSIYEKKLLFFHRSFMPFHELNALAGSFFRARNEMCYFVCDDCCEAITSNYLDFFFFFLDKSSTFLWCGSPAEKKNLANSIMENKLAELNVKWNHKLIIKRCTFDHSTLFNRRLRFFSSTFDAWNLQFNTCLKATKLKRNLYFNVIACKKYEHGLAAWKSKMSMKHSFILDAIKWSNSIRCAMCIRSCSRLNHGIVIQFNNVFSFVVLRQRITEIRSFEMNHFYVRRAISRDIERDSFDAAHCFYWMRV